MTIRLMTTRLGRAVLPLLLLTQLSLPAAADTLYDQLGGQPGITLIVGKAVALYLTDDRIKADFDNINLDRLRSRLADKLCQLAGGPCQYRGRAMAASHNGLEVTQAKFDAVSEDLQTAMTQAGVPYSTQNRLRALLAPMQRDIVTR